MDRGEETGRDIGRQLCPEGDHQAVEHLSHRAGADVVHEDIGEIGVDGLMVIDADRPLPALPVDRQLGRHAPGRRAVEHHDQVGVAKHAWVVGDGVRMGQKLEVVGDAIVVERADLQTLFSKQIRQGDGATDRVAVGSHVGSDDDALRRAHQRDGRVERLTQLGGLPRQGRWNDTHRHQRWLGLQLTHWASLSLARSSPPRSSSMRRAEARVSSIWKLS